MTRNTYFAVLLVLFVSTCLIHLPSASEERQAMPFEGNFGINSHPLTGNFLYFEGVFTQAVMNLSVVAENPDTEEEALLAQGVTVLAGQTVTISPFTAPWTWMPGEKLTLKAPGLKPYIVTIPQEDSPEWQSFIAKAQAYTQRQAAAMRMNQMSNPNMNVPWPAMPAPQPQWQQQSPGWGGSTSQGVCPHCNGKGTVERRHAAPYYGGDDSESRWETIDVPCPLCGGTGKR